MIIRPTTEMDIKLFKPSIDDIAEANELGIEPTFQPGPGCVTLCAPSLMPMTPLAVGGNTDSQVWFVTSKHVWTLDYKSKREFRRLIMEYRDQLLTKYPYLWNYVYVGNTSHVRFLKTIGAVFHEDFTGNRKQFQLFTIGG